MVPAVSSPHSEGEYDMELYQHFRQMAKCPVDDIVRLRDYDGGDDWTVAFENALADCADRDVALDLGSETYPVGSTITIGPVHRGRHIYGRGATIQVRPDFVSSTVFELRGFQHVAGQPEGGHLTFSGFEIVGEYKAKTSEQLAAGFASVDGVPKGTVWRDVRCENLLFGWDLSGTFSNQIDHCGAYHCAQGVRGEGMMGTTHIGGQSDIRRNGCGIYITDCSKGVQLVIDQATVIEGNGWGGLHAAGDNRGYIALDAVHFEHQPVHLAVEGSGLDVRVSGCGFGDCVDCHIRLGEVVVDNPSEFSPLLRTRSSLNRYYQEKPAITIVSPLQGDDHVFDACPVVAEEVECTKLFASPNPLYYWEPDGNGQYARAPRTQPA